MKSFLLSAMFFLASCGSADDKLADAIAASNATPTPVPVAATVLAPTPKAEPTSSPTATPKNPDDLVNDYKKISKGMTVEQIFAILGTAHKSDDSVSCFDGKCTNYHWCYWYYGRQELMVRFAEGKADYTSAN